MAPTPERTTRTLTVSVESFVSVDFKHFDRALHVGLDDDEQFLDLRFAERLDAALGGLRERLLAGDHLALVRDLLRLGDVGDDLEGLARLRHALKSEDFDGRGRAGLVDDACRGRRTSRAPCRRPGRR